MMHTNFSFWLCGNISLLNILNIVMIHRWIIYEEVYHLVKIWKSICTAVRCLRVTMSTFNKWHVSMHHVFISDRLINATENTKVY